MPAEEPVKFLAFETEVEGARVQMETKQRALAGGEDYTALLQRVNVPLSSAQNAAQDAIRALPRKQQEKLLALGLAGRRCEKDAFAFDSTALAI